MTQRHLGALRNFKPRTHFASPRYPLGSLGDESGTKLIEQRGIDFAPAGGFMQSLKAAGASEAFLKVLRARSRLTTCACRWGVSMIEL
jgi:hypothetical protein